MAEGFRRAGIEFAFAFDKDPNAVASYEENLGHRPICIDVRDLLRMVKDGWGMHGELDLIVADPPCTPYSLAGKRLGPKDERDMLRQTCELIALLRPRAYLIGNVPGLDTADNWPIVQELIGTFLSKEGYCVLDYASLDAADFGWVELCENHAHFVDTLSASTIVRDTAESIRRRGARTPTESALLAGFNSARTIRPDIVGNVTLKKWEELLAEPKGRRTQTGREASASTSADMCESESTESTNDNIESTWKKLSGESLKLAKLYITATKIAETTRQKTSNSTRTIPSTCENISKAAREVAACAGCKSHATPQHRVRPFWYGHLAGPCIRWPERTHCAPHLLGLPGVTSLEPWVTVKGSAFAFARCENRSHRQNPRATSGQRRLDARARPESARQNRDGVAHRSRARPPRARPPPDEPPRRTLLHRHHQRRRPRSPRRLRRRMAMGPAVDHRHHARRHSAAGPSPRIGLYPLAAERGCPFRARRGDPSRVS